jgi:hypothetical protein
VFFGYAIPVIDYKFYNTFLGATPLPPGALAVLLLLMLVVNPLLGLLSRRLHFSRNEILTIYITCLFSCLVPGIGGNNYFVSYSIGIFYFATRENGWFDFLKGLPPWSTPALNADGTYNRYVVEAWYTGLRPNEVIPWGAWIVPLLAWSALFLAIFGMQSCLAVMLRAQWGGREALAFPLLRLPLELTEDVDRQDKYGLLGRFFRNPMMWAGFGIAVFIQGINGLHVYYPDWPVISTNIDTSQLFTETPWNQMGTTPIRIWPIAIGIAFLLSTEVSFSLWFFYWFMKLQFIVAYYAGFPSGTLPNAIGFNQKAFISFQSFGAYLVFVTLIMWTGREHFGHVFRRAIGRDRARDDEKNEALPYPIAFWGFLLCFCCLVTWAIAAGIHPLLALALWASYLITLIVMSRVIAEGGLMFVAQVWQPLGVLIHLAGSTASSWISPAGGIAQATLLETACIRDFRGSLMPSFVQGFKLAHDRKINSRHLYLLVFAVILIGMAVSIQMNVRLGYDHGGLSLQGWFNKTGPQMTGNSIRELGSGPRDVGWINWFWTAIGGFFTYLIMLARSRFVGFPLHPIGYMVAVTYPMNMLWFSIFVGWMSKVLIMRFGGIDTYRKTTFTFLGLAFGDVAMMLFWIIIDGWQGRTGHQLMPG